MKSKIISTIQRISMWIIRPRRPGAYNGWGLAAKDGQGVALIIPEFGSFSFSQNDPSKRPNANY